MTMCNVKRQYKNQGFTLIELILVILLLGIMAATVIPKMSTSSGYAEHGYINEVVTKLRAIQLRAMQNTDDVLAGNVDCRNVTITSKTLFNDTSCDLWGSSSTAVVIDEADINFDLNQDTTFSFDGWGRPVGCVSSPCVIMINGREGDLTVHIESEGFIHVL